MNILMLVVLLLICVFSIPLIYNLFDLLGLKILFIINIIMMFITSFKNIELINLNISLSSIFILPLTALLIISSYKIKPKDLKSNIKQILFIITFIIIEIILLSMYQHSVNYTTTSNVINILLYNYISYSLINNNLWYNKDLSIYKKNRKQYFHRFCYYFYLYRNIRYSIIYNFSKH